MKFSIQKDIQVMNLFKSNGILCVSQLSIENIANVFNMHIEYYELPSKCRYEDNFAFVYLKHSQPLPHIRKDFFHELTHYLFHFGDQKKMSEQFRSLQEGQANRISLYASMPRHIFEPLMLKYRSIKKLAELFELPEEMIKERIEIFKNERQLNQAQLSLQAREVRRRKKSLQPGQVYDSTIAILNQLKNQVGEERMSYEVKRLLR